MIKSKNKMARIKMEAAAACKRKLIHVNKWGRGQEGVNINWKNSQGQSKIGICVPGVWTQKPTGVVCIVCEMLPL